MRNFAIVLAFAACAAGCQKSADDQFEEMYRYQQENDPDAAKITANLYRYKDNLSNDDKLKVVQAYDAIKRQRKVVSDLKEKIDAN